MNGWTGFTKPAQSAGIEFEGSVNFTAPVVNQIVAQIHEPADEAKVCKLQRCMRRVKDDGLHEKRDNVKSSLPEEMQRVVELASEKGSSN